MSVYPAPIDFDPAIHPILSRHWFGAELGSQMVIGQKLDTYAELQPETLEVTGGDGFWPAPLHEVRRTP